MQITITKALNDLKLLDSKISNAISNAVFIGAKKKSSPKVTPTLTKEEFETNSKASLDSVTALINNRMKIKSAIVDSNAKTLVEIGGITMTVAEAIEQKTSIGYRQSLLRQMSTQYVQSNSKVNVENEKVQLKLDELIKTSFGGDKAKVNADDIKAISEPYLAQNEFEIIDPLKLKDKIDALQSSIETFMSEVDYVLSVSNATTFIDVE